MAYLDAAARCTNIEAEKVVQALEECKEAGIRNIVALRGDAPAGQDKWEATEGGFNCAMDLVKYMRETTGDYFCISVAGYPEGHPDKIKAVPGGVAALSASEKTRYSVQTAEDGTETVSMCSDADFEVEMVSRCWQGDRSREIARASVLALSDSVSSPALCLSPSLATHTGLPQGQVRRRR